MKVLRVQQKLVNRPLTDVAGEVRRQLDSLGLAVPRGRVAVTGGSRGIDHMPLIVRTVGAWLSEKGASPFLVPCMGSHNGATADGQRAMLETLGMTEDATGLPIRSSMDVVKVGHVASGDVYMDRYCFEADGVIVLNRVKLHTFFSGPVQSGLMKMMVVGMGKIQSATTFHSTPADRMADMIVEMGRCVLNTGKILAGLAILEDGFDQTAELHALHPQDIPTEEPRLVQRHRHYFPRLPVDDLNVLVVDEIGKLFSGTGMDTNVIGYRGVKGHEDLPAPRIRVMAALGLAPQSQGNAIGVGLADFITRRLRDAIDERKTMINALTTGEMQRAKIPATLADDEDVIRTIAKRYGDKRWMFIPNTLHLGCLYATPDLLPELREQPGCDVEADATELTFLNGRHQLHWSWPRHTPH